MKPALWNLVLALLWVALAGDFSVRGLLVGMAIGYVVIILAGPAVGVRGYGGHVVRILLFLVVYLWDLFLSNLRVARDVMRVRSRSRPAFIAVSVEGLTPHQITLLANLITMTPGTLSIDVSDDESTLYVHAMFVDDPDETRRDIEEGLIRRVKGVIE